MATHIYGDGTNSTSGANTKVHWYDHAGVKMANEVNVYQQFVDRRSMPMKNGKQYKVSKWLNIYDRNPATDPEFESKGYLSARDLSAIVTSNGSSSLAEGAADVNQVTVEKVTLSTSLQRYGNMIKYTDEVVYFSEDSVQVQYREALGRLINRRNEDLIQADMLSSPTRMYSGTAGAIAEVGVGTLADGSTDDEHKITYDMIRKMGRKLVRNRAEKNTEIVTGSNKIDTKTVNRSFYAIIGSDVKFDLESVKRGAGSVDEYMYIPRNKYASSANLAENEVGATHDMRFIESESQAILAAQGAKVPQNYVGSLQSSGGTDNTSANAADRDNFDVHPIIIPTKGSFATVGLKGKGKVSFHAQKPSVISETNPYGTKGFFSANFWYAGIILQEERLLIGYVCASK